MAKFIKTEIVDAEQFLPPNHIPDGILNVHHNGHTFTGIVYTSENGMTMIYPGHWIVTDNSGNKSVHSPEEFDKNFQMFIEIKKNKVPHE